MGSFGCLLDWMHFHTSISQYNSANNNSFGRSGISPKVNHVLQCYWNYKHFIKKYQLLHEQNTTKVRTKRRLHRFILGRTDGKWFESIGQKLHVSQQCAVSNLNLMTATKLNCLKNSIHAETKWKQQKLIDKSRSVHSYPISHVQYGNERLIEAYKLWLQQFFYDQDLIHRILQLHRPWIYK